MQAEVGDCSSGNLTGFSCALLFRPHMSHGLVDVGDLSLVFTYLACLRVPGTAEKAREGLPRSWVGGECKTTYSASAVLFEPYPPVWWVMLIPKHMWCVCCAQNR